MAGKPRDSALRDAFVGILMTVGPFFGVRYRPPRVEIPVVTTPASEIDDELPGYQRNSNAGQQPEDEASSDDGLIV